MACLDMLFSCWFCCCQCSCNITTICRLAKYDIHNFRGLLLYKSHLQYGVPTSRRKLYWQDSIKSLILFRRQQLEKHSTKIFLFSILRRTVEPLDLSYAIKSEKKRSLNLFSFVVGDCIRGVSWRNVHSLAR